VRSCVRAFNGSPCATECGLEDTVAEEHIGELRDMIEPLSDLLPL
jgi:hypothetical protein